MFTEVSRIIFPLVDSDTYLPPITYFEKGFQRQNNGSWNNLAGANQMSTVPVARLD
jgi:hypothetical protein